MRGITAKQEERQMFVCDLTKVHESMLSYQISLSCHKTLGVHSHTHQAKLPLKKLSRLQICDDKYV